MRVFPFEKFTVTSTFQDHINSGGDRAAYSGVDLRPLNDDLSPAPVVGSNIMTPEPGALTRGVDQYGAIYANLLTLDGQTIYQMVHLSECMNSATVPETYLFGKTGYSGWVDPPGIDGAHTHLTVIRWLNGGWVRVDPMIHFWQEGFALIQKYRNDVIRAGYTVQTIYDWWQSKGYYEFIETLGKRNQQDVITWVGGSIQRGWWWFWQYTEVGYPDGFWNVTSPITPDPIEPSDPCATIKAENAKLKSDLEEMSKTVTLDKNAVTELMSKIAEKDIEIQKLKSQVPDQLIVTQNTELSLANKKLKESVGGLQLTIKNQNTEIDQLRKQIEEMKASATLKAKAGKAADWLKGLGNKLKKYLY